MTTTADMIPQPLIEPNHKNSIVKPYVLSHGTLECYSLQESRPFYEEFLGLECVRHGRRTMAIRCGLKFHIVCVEAGDRLHPVNVMNHWGLDVQTREAVDAAHEAAVRLKEHYKIRQVFNPVDQHGVYSFYLMDLDRNFWEIQHFPGFQHDEFFNAGDRFSMDQVAPLTKT